MVATRVPSSACEQTLVKLDGPADPLGQCPREVHFKADGFIRIVRIGENIRKTAVLVVAPAERIAMITRSLHDALPISSQAGASNPAVPTSNKRTPCNEFRVAGRAF